MTDVTDIPQIQSTEEYDKFVPHNTTCTWREDQPAVSKLGRLVKAIDERNYLKYFPIHVTSPDDDGKHYIMDGNKRYFVAEHLGVPVYYMEVDESVTPAALAEAIGLTEKWTLYEYLSYWSGQDDASSFKTLSFIGQHDLLPTAVTAVQLLSGNVMRNKSTEQMVRRGSFRITHLDWAEKIMAEIAWLLEYVDKRKLHLTQLLIRAFTVLYSAEEFSAEAWHKSVKRHASSLLENQATLEQNFHMLRALHNGNRSSDLVPDTTWRKKHTLEPIDTHELPD